eukprot:6116430-Pyramimonas_sp.AAC.1
MRGHMTLDGLLLPLTPLLLPLTRFGPSQVAAMEGAAVAGVFRSPRTRATAAANVSRACMRLCRHRDMSRRFLFMEDQVSP